MNKKYFWLIIIVLVLLAIVALRLASGEDVWLCTDGNWVKHGQPSAPMPIAYCPGGSAVNTNREGLAGEGSINNQPAPEVIISEPAIDGLVASPLKVNGQAKGNWFFEAVLPVKLFTAAGEELASTSGRAQSNWMTDQLVPFSATLNFTTTATSGYLLVARDNPSGLPENAAEVKIPVNFK